MLKSCFQLFPPANCIGCALLCDSHGTPSSRLSKSSLLSRFERSTVVPVSTMSGDQGRKSLPVDLLARGDDGSLIGRGGGGGRGHDAVRHLMSSNSLDQVVTGPLLGAYELQRLLPDQKVRIQVLTWNMGSLPLPNYKQLRDLFYHDDGHDPEGQRNVDVHVVAIQECWPDSDAWEVEVQACLGHNYALFHSLSFGTLHLAIFMRRDLIWYTTETVDSTQSVRSGRLFKTKGSASVGFGLFGSRFLVINGHLTAGESAERINNRVEELRRVLDASKKGMSELSNAEYDAVFLCGDLNFRMAPPHMTRDLTLESIRKDDLAHLRMYDELTYILRSGGAMPSAFKGFQEAAEVKFRPTYKYDLGTDNFDSSSKKRVPAYTDRVLFKVKSTEAGKEVECVAYDAVTSVRVSDHRPVYAVFSLPVKHGYDTLPMTGGRFKRDVFVKGIQKHARYLLERRKMMAATVCHLS